MEGWVHSQIQHLNRPQSKPRPPGGDSGHVKDSPWGKAQDGGRDWGNGSQSRCQVFQGKWVTHSWAVTHAQARKWHCLGTGRDPYITGTPILTMAVFGDWLAKTSDVSVLCQHRLYVGGRDRAGVNPAWLHIKREVDLRGVPSFHLWFPSPEFNYQLWTPTLLSCPTAIPICSSRANCLSKYLSWPPYLHTKKILASRNYPGWANTVCIPWLAQISKCFMMWLLGG